MGGWGVSRVRRVECGAVLLPVSSVAVSSASVIRHAWVARCRLSGAVQAAAATVARRRRRQHPMSRDGAASRTHPRHSRTVSLVLA